MKAQGTITEQGAVAVRAQVVAQMSVGVEDRKAADTSGRIRREVKLKIQMGHSLVLGKLL